MAWLVNELRPSMYTDECGGLLFVLCILGVHKDTISEMSLDEQYTIVDVIQWQDVLT